MLGGARSLFATLGTLRVVGGRDSGPGEQFGYCRRFKAGEAERVSSFSGSFVVQRGDMVCPSFTVSVAWGVGLA